MAMWPCMAWHRFPGETKFESVIFVLFIVTALLHHSNGRAEESLTRPAGLDSPTGIMQNQIINI